MDSDILKVVVVLTAFFYFNLKLRPNMNRFNYWIANTGLLLLLFASVLDFADGFQSLNNIPVLGRNAPFHDIMEDQLGDTPGLALFALGMFKQILRRKK